MVTISKVAAEVGLSTDAIRYYERIGLLPQPKRTPGGYRLYGQDTAERLQLIKGAQRLGLRLSEIGELLKVRDRGLCPCGHVEALVRQRLAEVDKELARLTRLRADM